jgi:SAM-dependent methyltransferase
LRIFNKKFSREEYINNQIIRSNDKFEYCKVSIKDVINWYNILKKINNIEVNNICCLGTRNGREIDLFRIVFFYRYLVNFIRLNEIRKNGWSDLLPFILNFNRSNINNISKISTIGVEINPKVSRQDTLISSFDELPNDWIGKFDLLYSNSFDQSQEPERTAKEWKRIIKKNGVLIFSFGDKEPTESDPVGNLNYTDIINLFGGELIYYNKFGSNYQDIIIRF